MKCAEFGGRGLFASNISIAPPAQKAWQAIRSLRVSGHPHAAEFFSEVELFDTPSPLTTAAGGSSPHLSTSGEIYMSPNQISATSAASGAIGGPSGAQTHESYGSSASSSASDARQFAQSLSKYKEQAAAPVSNVASASDSNSMGSRLMDNVAEASSRLAAEHKKISEALNRGLASGDAKAMTQAGLAVMQYVEKSALITQTVAATARGLETLTRLQ